MSLGLAPVVVKEIYQVLPVIKAEGTAMVVVEQDINRALEVADRVYCLQEGRLALTGHARRADPRPDRGGLFRDVTSIPGGMTTGPLPSQIRSKT